MMLYHSKFKLNGDSVRTLPRSSTYNSCTVSSAACLGLVCCILICPTYGKEVSINPHNDHREYNSKPIKHSPLPSYPMGYILQKWSKFIYSTILNFHKKKFNHWCSLWSPLMQLKWEDINVHCIEVYIPARKLKERWSVAVQSPHILQPRNPKAEAINEH
jgi:hypothetical protein